MAGAPGHGARWAVVARLQGYPRRDFEAGPLNDDDDVGAGFVKGDAMTRDGMARDGGTAGRDETGRDETGSEFVDELRALADRLATSGGEVARRMLAEFSGEGLGATSKSSATDPVTVIDTSVEEHLRHELAEHRPTDSMLGEETGETPARDEASRIRWVVDPVDGTVNLLYGIPFTAVSVAAEIDGVVVVGAVHNIVSGETWTAARGRGATLRGADGTVRPLAASGCSDLSLALVGTGFAYDAAVRAEQGHAVAALLPRVRDIRRCGSAALDLCMLATGRLDAYYERCLKPWDHAAGALIAAEAGAFVAPSDDDAVPTVAAAPGIAEEFRLALQDCGAL